MNFNHKQPRLAPMIFLLMLGSTTVSQAQPRMQDPYQRLEAAARSAHDDPSIRLLVDEIVGQVLFAPLPPSVYERIVRAELRFVQAEGAVTTESRIADAVNILGDELSASIYTGTNATQLRLLRIAMLRDIPHLLRSPTPAADNALVGSDLSPAGGLYLGLLLLRQKLTNPAWFGHPDDQNRTWSTYRRSQAAKSPASSRLPRISSDPPQVAALIRELNKGQGDENSRVTSAFHAFLDHLGFQ